MTEANPARDLAVSCLIDLGLTRGAATGIVRDWRSLSALGDATPERLARHGVRPAQARRILAAFRLARLADGAADHSTAREGPARCKLHTPAEVVATARALWGHAPVEHFAAFYLDARQRVIDHRVVAIGTLAQVDVHPRELFSPAMEPPRAHSVILVHNHPSGDPEPSDSDVALTRRMIEVGRLVGVPVLDHVIVTRSAYTSLAAVGLLE